MDALLRAPTARVVGATGDYGDELRRHRVEVRFGYGWPAFGGRYTAAPSVGFGLSNTTREYIHGWRLSQARSSVVGFSVRRRGDAARERRGGSRAPAPDQDDDALVDGAHGDIRMSRDWMARPPVDATLEFENRRLMEAVMRWIPTPEG